MLSVLDKILENHVDCPEQTNERSFLNYEEEALLMSDVISYDIKIGVNRRTGKWRAWCVEFPDLVFDGTSEEEVREKLMKALEEKIEDRDGEEFTSELINVSIRRPN